MTDHEMSDQAAGYALNALSDDDRVAFEQHLASCTECRQSVTALQEGAAILGRSERADVPELFRRRVLHAVAGQPQHEQPQPDPTPVPVPARWRTRLTAIAAALVAVMATVAVVAVLTGDRSTDRIVSAADAVTVSVSPTPDFEGAVTGSFTFSNREEASVLTMSGLPAVGEGRTYQLWFVGEAVEASSLFVPGADNTVEVVVDRSAAGADLIGITVEPEGGSTQPTTPILFTAELSA